MSLRNGKKKTHLLITFMLTLFGVLVIGCIVLFILYGQQGKETICVKEESVSLSEKSDGTLVDALKSEKDTLLHTNTQLENESEIKAEIEPVRDVTIAFAGDILLDDNYSMMATLYSRANGIRDCIDESLMREMNEADVFILNNEFTFTDRGEPLPEKQFTFRSKPQNVSILKEMGVDVVSLANNHAYDYGEVSLLDTMETLDGAGILYAGAGRNIEEASAPVYYEVGGMKLGIVAATQIERLDYPDTKGATADAAGVFRCWNSDAVLTTVKEAKENCDFVIAFIHWGSENTEEVDWSQKELAQNLAEAGADLIIGNHSHCLQPIEYVENVPAIYSLGNFWFNSKTVDTCIVKAVVGKEGLKSLQFVPALQSGCTTRMLHGTEKERVLEYMRSLSENVCIDSEGYIEME